MKINHHESFNWGKSELMLSVKMVLKIRLNLYFFINAVISIKIGPTGVPTCSGHEELGGCVKTQKQVNKRPISCLLFGLQMWQ